MISAIEALRFRCLRYVRQPLRAFHVLVGPNASGKTTFLDVVAFLSRLVSDGLDAAVGERTHNFSDLLWKHEGDRFELAIEARIPDGLRPHLDEDSYDTIRYEVGIRVDPESEATEIFHERGLFIVADVRQGVQRSLFPNSELPPDTLQRPDQGKSRTRRLFTKTAGGNDNYYADARPRHGRWAPAFKLGPRKSTLANLPEDDANFPVSTWFKQFLADGVEQIVLDSLKLRKASPPGQGFGFRPDGSNLPWVVAGLERSAPDKLRQWVAHVRTALPDLQHIRTVERADDKHRYLVLQYDDGLEIPSWMASDGTLRLLALTIAPYLNRFKGVYLIEEPENGIHPRAVETMYQSISSVYDAQVLVATHSPVILSVVEPRDLLCFAKTSDGATDIVSGDEHPRLQDWKREENLSTLFAAGVLG